MILIPSPPLAGLNLPGYTTAHRRFQEWEAAGVFKELRTSGLEAYDELKGLDCSWLSMDGAMTKAPLGGGKNQQRPYGKGQVRNQPPLLRASGMSDRITSLVPPTLV